MSDRTRLAVFAACAIGAIILYATGITGRGGSWLAHVGGALALLTLGFFVESGRREPSGAQRG